MPEGLPGVDVWSFVVSTDDPIYPWDGDEIPDKGDTVTVAHHGTGSVHRVERVDDEDVDATPGVYRVTVHISREPSDGDCAEPSDEFCRLAGAINLYLRCRTCDGEKTLHEEVGGIRGLVEWAERQPHSRLVERGKRALREVPSP